MREHRLESIHIMRGIAASMVVVSHLGYPHDVLAPYGALGVSVFFVISGFVIPHAMLAAAYQAKEDAWPFLLRRVIRPEPVYILAILTAVRLGRLPSNSNTTL